MEQHQFPNDKRMKKMWRTYTKLAPADSSHFVSKWLDGDDHIRIKNDGCPVGDNMDKPVIATCDSWLKVQIEMAGYDDITFSADAVMFVNGEIGEYTQTFRGMMGTVEFLLPVAEGCKIVITSIPASVPWAGFILIPMEDNAVAPYQEDLNK